MLHYIRNILCIAPIFVLAGCWQKIEYAGKPIASAKTADSQPAVTEVTAEAKPVGNSELATAPASAPIAEVASVPPAAEFHAPAASPTANGASIATPKIDDDRHAIPATSDDSASSSRLAANDTRALAPAEQQSPTRHTDATTVSANIDVSAPMVTPKVRRAVWTLGSRLSLAALAHDRRMAANSIPNWLDEAHSAGKVLETTVPELPEPAAPGDTSLASRQVIDYLLAQGQRIGRDLSKRYGPEQAALFEVALKSNILLLLYSPDSEATNSISAAITRAAPQAKLPDVLWTPLVDRMNKNASLKDVRAAVKQMHSEVDAYLASAAEPTAR
jgi:hypothetical protein